MFLKAVCASARQGIMFSGCPSIHPSVCSVCPFIQLLPNLST